MSALTPLNGHIILKPIEEEEQLAGNIIIPDLGKEKPEVGEVIATSNTYNWHKGESLQSSLNVGDKVLIPKMGSQRITVGMDEYFITKETEILAILN
jgi:chaperonin GroES